MPNEGAAAVAAGDGPGVPAAAASPDWVKVPGLAWDLTSKLLPGRIP